MSVLDGAGMEASANTLGEPLLTQLRRVPLGCPEPVLAGRTTCFSLGSQSGLGGHQGQSLLTRCLTIFSLFSNAAARVTPSHRHRSSSIQQSQPDSPEAADLRSPQQRKASSKTQYFPRFSG